MIKSLKAWLEFEPFCLLRSHSHCCPSFRLKQDCEALQIELLMAINFHQPLAEKLFWVNVQNVLLVGCVGMVRSSFWSSLTLLWKSFSCRLCCHDGIAFCRRVLASWIVFVWSCTWRLLCWSLTLHFGRVALIHVHFCEECWGCYS